MLGSKHKDEQHCSRDEEGPEDEFHRVIQGSAANPGCGLGQASGFPSGKKNSSYFLMEIKRGVLRTKEQYQ